MMKWILGLLICFSATFALAQQKTGGVRGTLFNKTTGEPIGYATVFLDGTSYGATTNNEGFFAISGVPKGNYLLRAQLIGFDTTGVDVPVEPGRITNQNLYLEEQVNESVKVEITAEREAQKKDVLVGQVQVTPQDIQRIPSAGGEADLAQYLQVIPGVVFTGDQGGQLYIRGGSPVQSRVLLDGLTIYNPFHSIGFFSVFETDIIRTADVYTGGFNATYGSRSSAIMDIKTREGDRKHLGGKVSVGPFVSKATVEGPLVPLNEKTGSSTSFILTAKHSYLKESSPIFYSYANEDGELPYNFTDIYGKVSFNGGNGSRLNAFGFSYNDNVSFNNVADFDWNSLGFGTNFRIIPGSAKTIMNGYIGYSNYKSRFQEGANSSNARSAGVQDFNVGLNFSNYLANEGELNYGFDLSFFTTELEIKETGNPTVAKNLDNTEPAGYVRYKGLFFDQRLIIEPSVRLTYYASIGNMRLEPRLGAKYNINPWLRVKFAGGLYSQNLISAVNERDVVNLFVGYLGGPDEQVRSASDITLNADSKLQTSWHLIGGVEANIGDNISINVEPYLKEFPQIVNLNRNRETETDPTYVAETGRAHGVDFSGKYDNGQLYLYASYSLGFVTRDDGQQEFYTHFDRRHNANVVASYSFNLLAKDEDRPWEVSMRWNLGSGFPFTLGQGFYQFQTFSSGVTTNYLQENNKPGAELGILYDEKVNGGRLPYYHRLDVSLKRTFSFSRYRKLQFIAGLTNAYNRENIFYFNRVEFTRVNQLPILPSFSLNYSF